MAGQVLGKVTAGGGTHLISNTFYGTCDTAAATAAKIVKLVDTNPNAATLITGMMLTVKFTNSNSVASPTLTVQTSSGTQIIAAKSIMRYGTTTASTWAGASWRAGAVVPFVYDGTNWVEVSSIDDNSTYSNASLGQGYGTCSTAASTAAKAVTLSSYALTTGGIVDIWFTTANTADVPTLNINSKGAKNIFVDNAVVSSTNPLKWDANTMLSFMYDGTQYRFLHSSRKGVIASSSQPTTTDTMVWIKV